MKFIVYVLALLFSIGCASAETPAEPPLPPAPYTVKQDIPQEEPPEPVQEPDAARAEFGGIELFGNLTVFAIFPDASFPSFLDQNDACLNRENSGLYAENIILRLEALERVRIDVFAPTFTAQLYVFDTLGELVVQSSGDDPLLVHNITEEEQEYSLLLTSIYSGDGGDYTINVGAPEIVEYVEPEEELWGPAEELREEELVPGWLTNDNPLSFENTSDLALRVGEETSGSLEGVDGIAHGGGYRNGAPAESYVFEAIEDEAYLIDVYSVVFDTYIYIEGPNNSFTTTNDDGGQNLNSRFYFEALATGTTRVTVTMYAADDDPGEYTILVRQLVGFTLPDPPTPPTEFAGADAVALEIGERYEGALEEGDGQLTIRGRDVGNADAYTISIPEGLRVLVVLSQNEFARPASIVVLDHQMNRPREISRGVASLVLTSGMGSEITIVVYGSQGDYVIRLVELD